LVVRVSFVLNAMDFAARGYLRQDFAHELLRLGKAVTQWTNRLAGDEARAWQQQFRSDVVNRLDEIIETCRRREEPVLDAEVARRQWDELAQASPPPDASAPSGLLANIRWWAQTLRSAVNRAAGWRGGAPCRALGPRSLAAPGNARGLRSLEVSTLRPVAVRVVGWLDAGRDLTKALACSACNSASRTASPSRSARNI